MFPSHNNALTKALSTTYRARNPPQDVMLYTNLLGSQKTKGNCKFTSLILCHLFIFIDEGDSGASFQTHKPNTDFTTQGSVFFMIQPRIM